MKHKALSPIDPQTFKQTMAHFASGVTVVTTCHEAKFYGMTVAAFASVSVEPPLVLVCVSNTATAVEPIARAEKFAASILAGDQIAIGARFAGMVPGVVDRFEGVSCATAVTGCPLVQGALAYVDCRVVHAYPGGDHTIFVGEVLAAHAREGTEALVFFKRTWHTLDK